MNKQIAILASALMLACASSFSENPDLVLRGEVKSDQNNTYIEVPFAVPAGVDRITVSFRYNGKEDRTTLDIGIADPQRFRGWSGGNKSTFTISLSDATPSYLSGEIVPGTWKLWIGVPNIRSTVTASYEAEIYFERAGKGAQLPEFADAPLRREAGWYRGDLHLHTAHSDGHCSSQTGKQVPCPVFLTLESATRRGLDFIAITDHNTISQYDALRELQPYFDRLLLIPGREITTFEGHANVYGPTDFIDFRVGSKSVPTMKRLLGAATSLHGLFSINHPGAPSGEVCMGCGWRADVDMSRIAAIEAVNGGSEEGPYSGIPFWEAALKSGYRPTAIGGSDNHDAQLPFDKHGSVGSPTTVVYANELSSSAILAGIRSGRVFIDLTASRDRLLDVFAEASGRRATMGEVLTVARGGEVIVSARAVACQGSVLRILVDGAQDPAIGSSVIASADQTLNATWRSDGLRHWLRADVVSPEGQLQVLGNPIYINF